MKLSITEHGKIIEIALGGAFGDGRVWEEHREEIAQAVSGKQGPILAVTMAGVESITSTGLGSLVALSKRMAAAGGEVVLAAVPPRILGVIKMTHLDRLFTIMADIETVKAERAAGAERAEPSAQ